MGKIIGHVDMDAFFASVEERDKPWLAGLPIVVGADPKGGVGRGVVATANYKAREYGIRSALPIQKAWQFSEVARKQGKPGAAFIVPSGRKYGEESVKVFSIVGRHVPHMVQTSIDEGYLDFSFLRSYKKAETLAKKIKREIKRGTKLTCSIGIGPNKMVAKIASDLEKPNGLTIVHEGDVLKFLEPMNVSVIPGVGPKLTIGLKQRGIATIKEARLYSWKELSEWFGSYGFDLYQKVRGISSSELMEQVERKSIGKHETFMEDTLDMEYIFSEFDKMAQTIVESLLRKKFRSFRTVVITIRFSDFETKTKSLTTRTPLCTKAALYAKAMKLALPFFDRSDNPQQKSIRLVGLRIEKLE